MNDKPKKTSAKDGAGENTAVQKSDEAVSQPTGKKTGEVRQDGLQIDGFGLPVNGPARARVLAELGVTFTPAGAPGDWNDELAAKARKLTEKFYG